MNSLPVGIIGSGFAAATVAEGLSAAGVKYECLDASESVKQLWPARSFTDFSLNRGVFGGLDVWGGGVSKMELEHHFGHWAPAEWRAVGSEIRRHKLGKLGANFSLLEVDPTMLRFQESLIALGGKKSLHGRIDVGRYSRRAKKALGQIQKVKIRSIVREGPQDETGWYGVRLDGSGSQDRRFRAIFMCSGPLLNAYLVALLTGKVDYAYGDHLTAVSGNIQFARHVFSGSIGATRSQSRGFSTFDFASGKGGEGGRDELVSLRISSPFAFPGIPRTNSSGGRFGFRKIYNLHWLADSRPSAGQLIRFSGLGTSRPSVVTVFDFPRTTVDWLQSTAKRVHSSLERMGVNVTANNNLERVTESNWGTQLFAAQHPYGTVPVSDEGEPNTVDRNLRLSRFQNVFVVGSSAFPDGRLQHPTSLVVALAAIAARAFIHSFDET